MADRRQAPHAIRIADFLREHPGVDLAWIGETATPQKTPLIQRVVRNLDRLRMRRHQAQGNPVPAYVWRPEKEWRNGLLVEAGPDSADEEPPELVIALTDHGEVASWVRHDACEIWSFCGTTYSHDPTTEAYAAVLSSDGVSSVGLYRESSATGEFGLLGLAEIRTHTISPELNRLNLERSCFRLIAEALECRAARPVDRRGAAPLTVPGRLSWIQTLRWLCRAVVTPVRSRLLGETGEVQWNVGIGSRAEAWQSSNLENVEWIPTRDDGFIADPFPVEYEGRTYVFVEQYHYAERIGFISVVDWQTGVTMNDARSVLAQPFHLSFPNVFVHDGHHYMLPEQADSGSLVLYRAASFPDEWRAHATLLADTHAADPVVFQHAGLWWLMFSRADYGSHDNNLQLYYAHQLTGPYWRHPMSPVRESLAGSRMAGQVFGDGKRLVRPAQDCSASYGGALKFFEIVKLDMDHYEERELLASSFDPARTPFLGVHTANFSPNWFVVDGFNYLVR